MLVTLIFVNKNIYFKIKKTAKKESVDIENFDGPQKIFL